MLVNWLIFKVAICRPPPAFEVKQVFESMNAMYFNLLKSTNVQQGNFNIMELETYKSLRESKNMFWPFIYLMAISKSGLQKP